MAVFKKYRGKRITAKDKNWDKGTWYVWKRVKGRIIHKSIPEAQTKQQAEAAERHLIQEMFSKRYGGENNTSFRDFASDRYLRYVGQKNVNIGAKRLYVGILVRSFGAKLLADITPQDCRDVQAKLRKGTISDSSVNRIMSTASRLFTLACEEGILDRNPMQYVRPLKEPPPRKRLLTNEEEVRLWMELEKDELLQRLVTLALNLPLRRGQLLAITPDAVDLENGLLLAVSSKGQKSRAIPLNSTAAITLRSMLADGILPFPLKDFRKRWSKATIAAGINKPGGKRGENFTFHDLRHQLASRLVNRHNVNPETVRQLYGHSDMSITQVYMNAEFETMQRALNSLDATEPQPIDQNDGPPN